jgi:hypothetical protein
MSIDDLISDFNEGHTNFLKYFGDDVATFLKIVHRRGKFDDLDASKLDDYYQNEFLLFLHENNKEKFWEEVLNYLDDVEIIDGKPMLVLGDRGDLAQLFCSNRNDMSQDTIESILNGDYDSYWSSYDLTDNIYRDVIEELTKENILIAKEYIINSVDGKQVEPHTDLLQSYADNQGHPDYLTIDQSNIDQIFDDEESMKELFHNELSDFNNELYSVYGSAYQSAYESELYDKVVGELNGEFDMENTIWITRPHTYNKNTEVHLIQIPILDFERFILDYLNSNKGYNNGSLGYHGSFLGLLKDEINCLSVQAPDYPDSRLVDKNINSYFSDYI